MPQNPSENDSNATWASSFDLDLPVVREGEGPIPASPPSYELMLMHARFLVDSGLATQQEPCPEPFVLD